MIIRGALMVCLLTWCVTVLSAQPVKRLYIANDDHSDFMWTANDVAYDSAFVKMLDYFLDQIDLSMNNPDHLQTRFNCDGSYWLRAYEKYRSPKQYARLISRIRSGHISSPLNFLVSTYGAQPTEAVLRGMYHAGQLERDHGLRFPLAVCMENQTLPLGLSSLWAGSGGRYSWRGVCGCATRFTNESLSSRKHQLYKYEGLDGRGVTMKWYARTRYNGRTLGGYAETRRGRKPTDAVGDMKEVIDDLEKMCDTISVNSIYPFNVAGAFGYGWDDLSTFNAPDFINAAKRYATPTRSIRVSNEIDFFEDVAKTYPILPVEKFSYGNEWDTYCVSMNETTAQVRRSTEKLRSAEALATMVALRGGEDITQRLSVQRKQAWEAFGLYWEHDWTADGPVSRKDRADWQIKLQRQITSYVDSLERLSRISLANQFQKTSARQFYVFNPLGWERSDVVDIELSLQGPVKVVDILTGKEAPSQLIRRSGKNFLRVLASSIPSLGYKLFEIRKGSSKVQTDLSAEGEVLQNKFYRIRVLPSGVISEWYDRQAKGRSLIKSVDGRLANDLGTKNLEAGTISVENKGPVSITLKAISKDPLPHVTRVTLYNDINRVEISDSIQANFGDLKTWAFSFNLNSPETHHEELGAILTAKKELRGGHYASVNGRYDYQTFNHFADISEKNYGVTLSNVDCSFFSLGKSTPDSLWENSSQLRALAGGQTDPYTGLSKAVKDTIMMGIYRQNGEKKFHYQFALASHAGGFDAVREMKFSMEHQNPLVAEMISGTHSVSSERSYSMMKFSDPSLIVWSIKPSEEGVAAGIMARIWNVRASESSDILKLPVPIQDAWQTSHIETNERKLQVLQGTVPVKFGKLEMNTFRLLVNK